MNFGTYLGACSRSSNDVEARRIKRRSATLSWRNRPLRGASTYSQDIWKARDERGVVCNAQTAGYNFWVWGKHFFWILNVKGVREAQKCRLPTCVWESQFCTGYGQGSVKLKYLFIGVDPKKRSLRSTLQHPFKKVGEQVWKAPAASSGGRPPSSGLLRRSAGQGAGEGGAKGDDLPNFCRNFHARQVCCRQLPMLYWNCCNRTV